jgi:hypothetical protein
VWADPAGLVGQLLADLTDGDREVQSTATKYVLEYPGFKQRNLGQQSAE